MIQFEIVNGDDFYVVSHITAVKIKRTFSFGYCIKIYEFISLLILTHECSLNFIGEAN